MLLASGTLGDVLPMAGLGRSLVDVGADIRIVTHPVYRPIVETFGLTWAPLDGDPNALLADPVFGAALRLGGRPLKTLRDTLRFIHSARSEVARMLRSAWRAARDAGCIVVGLPTTWGQTIAERLDVPCIWALCQPIGRTAAFPSPLQPWGGSIGGTYNRLSHILAEQSLWRPWRAQLESWRAELGLARHGADPFASARRAGSPFVYLHSPSLLPRPTDWPANHVVAGHWHLKSTYPWNPSPALGCFLDAGAVFAGFGSMAAGREHELATQVYAAALRSGRRIVLQLARPELAPPAPPEVLVIGSAPHDQLLQRVTAAVHHGGAGTTHATLRAGLPSVTVPFGVDQHFWGRRVAALGAGLAPLGQRRLVRSLAVSIEQLASEPRLRLSAQHLGQQLRGEDGIAVAAGVVLKAILG